MTVFRVEKTKDFTVMTALQLIAEASRCPVYELERILALRNRLFTAVTRSKAWVRVLGTGSYMEKLMEE